MALPIQLYPFRMSRVSLTLGLFVSCILGLPALAAPDGIFVATTYGHWMPEEEPYIVSVRFTLDELDALAQVR